MRALKIFYTHVMAYATVNLSVDMLKPVLDTTGLLRCEAKVVHRGGRIAIATGDVVGERDGKVYARGQSTCLIYPVDGGKTDVTKDRG